MKPQASISMSSSSRADHGIRGGAVGAVRDVDRELDHVGHRPTRSLHERLDVRAALPRLDGRIPDPHELAGVEREGGLSRHAHPVAEPVALDPASDAPRHPHRRHVHGVHHPLLHGFLLSSNPRAPA
jgi:hypothetical protein